MTRAEILQTAEQMVNGSRQEDYGEPEDNFQKIADLWSAYFGTIFTAHDVAMMLVLMKAGRISNAFKKGKFHKDSYIDVGGYIACAAEIASRKYKDQGKNLDDLTIEDIAKFCADNNIDLDFLVKSKHTEMEG